MKLERIESMATIYDIAKLANVSPMTVSRVINDSKNVSESTRAKVNRAIQELNYIPNSSARYLTSKKSNILSLVITDIRNPFFTKLARGAEDKAKQMGYRLLLCNSDEDIHKESDYINMLISTGVDGVMITPSEDGSSENLQILHQNDIPFILLDRRIPSVKCDEIHGDSRSGTRRILEHLIQSGHQRIAMINGPLKVSTARERHQAYIDTLTVHQLPIKEEYILQSHFKNDQANISNLLSIPIAERPTAIFAANNFIAINTIKELRKQNICVPEDISVACFDDLDSSLDLNPFLTVVSQPAYQFGYLGAEMLIERIEATAPPEFRKVVLPSELIVRKSTTSV